MIVIVINSFLCILLGLFQLFIFIEYLSVIEYRKNRIRLCSHIRIQFLIDKATVGKNKIISQLFTIFQFFVDTL